MFKEEITGVEIIELKDIQKARFYFNDNILPKLAEEVEAGVPIEELFNMWIKNPTEYEPDKVIIIKELEDNSDIYDITNCHQQ